MGGGGTNQENQLEDDPTAGLDREGSLGETGRGTTGHGEPHHGASEQVWLKNLPKGGKSSRPGKREENQGIEVSGRQICPKPFVSTRSIPFLLFLSDVDPCDLRRKSEAHQLPGLQVFHPAVRHLRPHGESSADTHTGGPDGIMVEQYCNQEILISVSSSCRGVGKAVSIQN